MIGKNATLGEGQAVVRLAMGRIGSRKTFGVGWIDVHHKDSGNVDGIFFEVIKRLNSIEDSVLMHLCA
jgi:hypothetical protein